MTTRASIASLCDPDAIRAALKLLLPAGQITELRALDAAMAGVRHPSTVSGYFDDPEKLTEAVSQIRRATGIYLVPNPVEPALLARSSNRLRRAPRGETTADAHIIRRNWLLIDADAIRPSGISSTDDEHEAAESKAKEVHAYLKSIGWPDPIFADSGNGFHLLYRIDLPADEGGLVARCLQSLADRFSDDQVKIDTTVANPARIWKLYGTRACKGDSTPERPHRMSRILSAPDTPEVVPTELLELLAGEAVQHTEDSPSVNHHGRIDVYEYIRHHNFDVTEPVQRPSSVNGQSGLWWEFNTSPLCDHHDRAAYLAQLDDGTLIAGCHHDSCSWRWQDLRRQYPLPGGPTGANRQAPRAASSARNDAVPVPPLPWRPFPLDVLPEPIRSMVRDGSQSLCCDPSFLALPALTITAAAIGNSRRLYIRRKWTAPAILWTAIVGDSGDGKSPAIDLCVETVKKRQADAMEQYQSDLRSHQQSLLQYERDFADWKKKKEGEPPEKPEEPAADRYLISDVTVEALAPILLQNPRGVLLVRDELAGWIGSFDRYVKSRAGSDASHWLSIHNGSSITVDRKTGQPRTIFVPRAAVSITGGIQPGILRKALQGEHRDSGLAARILFAYPPRRAKRWNETEISEELELAFTKMLGRLYGLPLKSAVGNGDSGQPSLVHLTPEAKRVWIEYFERHAAELADAEGDVAAAYAKLEEAAARLALVCHLASWSNGEAGNPDLLDEQSMRAGITLAEWFKHEACRVYQMLDEPEEAREQRSLVAAIQRKGGTVTARDLMRSSRRFIAAKDAEDALDNLVRLGQGSWVMDDHAGGRGRPARTFVLAHGNTMHNDDPQMVEAVDTIQKQEGRQCTGADTIRGKARSTGPAVDTNSKNPGENRICVNVNRVGPLDINCVNAALLDAAAEQAEMEPEDILRIYSNEEMNGGGVRGWSA